MPQTPSPKRGSSSAVMRAPGEKPSPKLKSLRRGERPLRVWITGGSGFLGTQLLSEADERRWAVQCLRGQNPLPPGRHSVLAVPLSDPEALLAAAKTHRPDVILHAAAKTSTAWCEANPEMTLHANVALTRNLVEAASRVEAHLIYTSTDLVFDGTGAPYAEAAEPSPLMVYGRSKMLAEEAVRASHAPWTICRCALMYGPRARDHFSCLSWLLDGLKSGEGVELFDDEFRTPADVRQVGRALCEIAEQGATGVYHLGGPERLSRLEFGRIVARTWSLPEETIRVGRLAERRLAPPRPPDVSLLSDRARRDVGYDHPPIAETLADLYSMFPDAAL